MTVRALERADVALLVIDAAEGFTDQDARVASLARERGCAVARARQQVGPRPREPGVARNGRCRRAIAPRAALHVRRPGARGVREDRRRASAALFERVRRLHAASRAPDRHRRAEPLARARDRAPRARDGAAGPRASGRSSSSTRRRPARGRRPSCCSAPSPTRCSQLPPLPREPAARVLRAGGHAGAPAPAVAALIHSRPRETRTKELQCPRRATRTVRPRCCRI